MRKTVTSLSVMIIFSLSLISVAIPLFNQASVSGASQLPVSVLSGFANSAPASTNSSSSSMGAIFSNPHVTSTVINQNTQFSLKWSDPSGVAGYIFSYDFGSGGFVNDSYIPLSNSTTVSTVATKTIPGNQGERIQWMFYVKDGNGIWSKSYAYAFVAGSSSSDVSMSTAALITDNAYDLLAYDGTYLVNLANFPQLVGTYGASVGFNQVKWNPQGTMALAIGYNNSAVLYSRTTGSFMVLSTGASVDTNLVGVTWAPNGTSALITGSNPDIILTYSTVTGAFTEVSNPTGVTGLGAIEWNPVSNYALIAGSNGLIMYSATGRLNPIPSASGISFGSISFSPIGAIALLTTKSGGLYEYSPKTSEVSMVASPGGTHLQEVAFSRDGAYALITGQSGSTNNMFKFSGQMIYPISSTYNGSATGISFTSDGSYAMITTNAGDILTEKYNENSTATITAVPNTNLSGIDFMPPQSSTTLTSTTISSTSSTLLGFISVYANTENYLGSNINLSGSTLTSGGGSPVSSQTIYVWINGQNRGSVTSNSSGDWTFSFNTNSSGVYYAVASQNQDGSGVTSVQLAVTVLPTTSTYTTSTTSTSSQNSSESSSTSNSSATSTTSSNSSSNYATESSKLTSSTSSKASQSNPQNFASMFEFVPFLTSSSHTPLETAIFTLEVCIIVALPFILARAVKKEKGEGGDGSRKWRW